MGIFSKNPSAPANQDLVAVAIRSSEGKLLISEDLIIKNQEGIIAGLDPDEHPVCVAAHYPHLVLITNRRSVAIRKGSFEKVLDHSEILRTSIRRKNDGSGFLVTIESRAAATFGRMMLPASPKIILVNADSEFAANSVCAAVDQFL